MKSPIRTYRDTNNMVSSNIGYQGPIKPNESIESDGIDMFNENDMSFTKKQVHPCIAVIPSNISSRDVCLDDDSELESGTKRNVDEALEELRSVVSVMSTNAKMGIDPLGINANTILGMERTLFSSLNNAWLLAMGGIGLMSVGNDQASNNGGVAMLSASMMLVCLAFMFHFHRAQQIQYGISTNWFTHTKVWASIVCALTLAVLLMEIYYAKKFPYLDRSWAVKVDGGDETNS